MCFYDLLIGFHHMIFHPVYLTASDTLLHLLPGKSRLLFHWQILLCIQAGFHPVFSSQYSESASFCKWSFFSFSCDLYGNFAFPF